MNIIDALDFINETKQPAAYFDHNDERYRFQNLEIKNNQTIYRYLSPSQEVSFTVRKNDNKSI